MRNVALNFPGEFNMVVTETGNHKASQTSCEVLKYIFFIIIISCR